MDFKFLLDLIDDDLFELVRVGSDVDPSTIIDSDNVAKAAMHCCINGPVGINKPTTFPGIPGEIKIKELFSGRISNRTWRKLCDRFAEHLTRSLTEEKLSKCQTIKLHGSLWPRYDED
jgi:hypothetical protein